MVEPRAKGVNFHTFIKILRRLRGDRIAEATLDLAPPELSRNFRAGLVFSGNWYPLSWYADLHRAAQKAAGAGPDLARTIGFESVKDDLAGIYRIFLLVVSPEFVLSKAPLLFSTYYDTGTMAVSEAARGQARAQFTGCTGFDRNLWLDVQGSCQAGLEAAGARDVAINLIAGGADGDTSMELEARWR
ncbi:MAG: hypothetical protein HY906_08885 [Deltaproteobacteria bacterium]|nr:hypothetical protein [Deltaproteobacteria bacterium]